MGATVESKGIDSLEPLSASWAIRECSPRSRMLTRAPIKLGWLGQVGKAAGVDTMHEAGVDTLREAYWVGWTIKSKPLVGCCLGVAFFFMSQKLVPKTRVSSQPVQPVFDAGYTAHSAQTLVPKMVALTRTSTSGWWLGHPSEKYGPSIGMIRNPIFLGKCQIDGNQGWLEPPRDEWDQHAKCDWSTKDD